jgi:hypothetical protein
MYSTLVLKMLNLCYDNESVCALFFPTMPLFYSKFSRPVRRQSIPIRIEMQFKKNIYNAGLQFLSNLDKNRDSERVTLNPASIHLYMYKQIM